MASIHTTTNMSEIAKVLRQLADEIDQSNIPEMHVVRWNHLRDVKDPAYGETIVDARFIGFSILVTTVELSVGSQERIRKVLDDASGCLTPEIRSS